MEALGQLLATYLAPLYVIARGVKLDHWDAEVAVNDFVVHCYGAKSPLFHYEAREDKKFRSFLQTCFRNFIKSRFREKNSLGRGGKAKHKPMLPEIERCLEETQTLIRQSQAPDEIHVDIAFAYAWWRKVMERVRQEATDIPHLDEHLANLLQPRTSRESIRLVAEKLGITSHQVRYAIERIKSRIQMIGMEEALRLTDDPEQAKEELRALTALLGRNPPPTSL